jgi:hypothetical protein
MEPRLFPALGFALLLVHPSWSQGASMQVEEPAGLEAPPVDPDLDGGHWKARPVSAQLNAAERAAYEERRKKVEEMAERIRGMREAVEHSAAADRAARVRDLENLVLEKDGREGSERSRAERLLEKKERVQDKAVERKLERLEKRLEKSLEKNREKLDKADTDGKDKPKRKGAGK